MTPPPFIAIKLRKGWSLDSGGLALRSPGRRIVPDLPPGARLRPALELPPQSPPTAVEHELARFVHLTLADPVSLEAAYLVALGWPFVEHAEIIER
jgi:hypothetical protein